MRLLKLTRKGMYGVSSFSAIINPPHSGILAVGGVRDQVISDGQGGFMVAKYASLTASFDHRTVDGAVGAKFMAKVVEYLEDPVKMLL
jgi:pyruvate dehydrogenase E2 component (dihydrolipoamide acetyltransferase)